MSDKIKSEFDKSNNWGITTSVDLYFCNPDFIRNENKIKEFVFQLCDLINVKKFGECVIVNFGEREAIQGYSMVQFIETSLISGHFANKTNKAYVDIFSCKYHNPEEVANFSKKFFQAKKYILHFTFRK